MRKLEVLIVDDDPVVSDFIKVKLATEAPHFSITQVESGLECLEYLKKNKADCILSDYQMPGMDGMELLKRLRHDGNGIPFIFITGQGNEEVASEAFKNGASDYFTKDIGFAHFPRIINSVERAAKGRRERIKREKAEAAFHEEKAKLEAILASMGDGISIQDRNFRVLYQNPAHRAMIGDHAGAFCYVAYEGSPERCSGCPVWAAFQDGRQHTTQREVAVNGERLVVEITASALKDGSGNIVAGIEAVRDITGREEYERRLRESEERYKTLVELTADFIYMSDRCGNIEFMNDAAYKMLETAPEEAAGRPWLTWIHPEDVEKTVACFGEMMRTGRDVFDFENRFISKSGKVVCASHNIRVRRNEKGEILGTQGIVRDVTAKKLAEEALRESEEKYRLLFESNPNPMLVYDIDSLEILAVNGSAVGHYGYSREEFLGLHAKDIFPADDLTEFVNVVEQIRNDGDKLRYSGTWRHRKKDGTIIDVQVASHSISFEGRNARVVLITDVTEQKKAEAALRESEAKFRSLVETSLVGVYIIKGRRIVYSNPRFRKMLGYTEEELCALDIASLIHPDELPKVRENYRKRLTGEVQAVNYQSRWLTKSGEVIDVEIFGTVIDYEGETAVLGEVVDITESRLALARLGESEAKFRSLVEMTFVGVYLVQGKFAYVNPQMEKITGYSREELLGFKDPSVLIAPSERAAAWKDFEKLYSGEKEIRNYQLHWIRKDGAAIDVEGVSSATTVNGRPAVIGTVIDVTEKKKAEEARSAMLHMLTHDIRGPLSVIYGFGSLASDLEGAESARAILDIQKAAQKIYSMIDNILSISRLESQEAGFFLQSASVDELVREAVKENEAAAAESGVSLGVIPGDAPPKIYCDSAQVVRAIGNVISNAINYNRSGGSVEVRSGLAGPREVFVEVSDTGNGIDDEDMPRIFDKYYRGKESRKKKGTGLGLAIVKAVVEGHGGRVDVRSIKGGGSSFRLVLPVKPGL